jgi:predicted amidohydrolase YtcJ
VTLIELLLALNAWKSAGVKTGDRIEHAAITPSAQLEDIANLGLRVVTQPHFIWQRGDRYRRHVDHRDQEDLYRLRSFLDAGVGLAAGSDAAHGTVNPWRAMQCAVDRSTMAGEIMGAEESLSPEQALALYTSELDAPGVSHRKIAIGEKANICLLDRAWYSARQNLAEVNVKLTLRHGKVIHSA